MLDHTTGYPTKTKQSRPWIAYTIDELHRMVAELEKHYRSVKVKWSERGQCWEIKCTGDR